MNSNGSKLNFTNWGEGHPSLRNYLILASIRSVVHQSKTQFYVDLSRRGSPATYEACSMVHTEWCIPYGPYGMVDKTLSFFFRPNKQNELSVEVLKAVSTISDYIVSCVKEI